MIVNGRIETVREQSTPFSDSRHIRPIRSGRTILIINAVRAARVCNQRAAAIQIARCIRGVFRVVRGRSCARKSRIRWRICA